MKPRPNDCRTRMIDPKNGAEHAKQKNTKKRGKPKQTLGFTCSARKREKWKKKRNKKNVTCIGLAEYFEHIPKTCSEILRNTEQDAEHVLENGTKPSNPYTIWITKTEQETEQDLEHGTSTKVDACARNVVTCTRNTYHIPHTLSHPCETFRRADDLRSSHQPRQSAITRPMERNPTQ